MAKDPYRYFRIEARELIEQLSKGVLALEQSGGDEERISLLLRWAHTLKGAARVVRQAQIADLLHGAEELLAPFRSSGGAVPRGAIDQLLAACDQVSKLLDQLPSTDADGEGSPGAAGPAAPAEDAPQRIVRADVLEVDVLLEGLGEIGAELAGMRRAIGTLDALRELALTAGSAQQGGRALAAQLDALERRMAGGAERIDRELRQTRDAAERLRLLPAGGVFTALERCARDAAHSSGKQVAFDASGSQLRIDGEVLDVVLGALLQLVRNAVAHGIETPDRRLASGKSAAGRITLEVSRRGYMAWFRLKDDGRGVDLAALRAALAKRGQPAPADDAALLARLLEGGVSTSGVVTELSGRGIGMDVVRAAMAKLGGKAHVSSDASGATFELCVPLSLAALDVLLVEADNQIMALPLDAVQGTLRVSPEHVVHSADGGGIVYEGQMLPLLPLAIGGAERAAARPLSPRAMTAVVVRSQGRLLALSIARLGGVDSVVLRALPPLAATDPMVLGLYLDMEGEPRMVLDPEELGRALARRGGAGEAAPPRPPILIVDDSLTTRMLESSILESAGYQVELAASAEEGLELARQNRYALFLVDVEMPGMDGFGFITEVRADPQLSDIPALLVTSLDTAEHKRRGSDAGANGYIVKNEFDQAAFLGRIGELVRQ
ncbi:hybrid sensor histidine kinase/response regulator [Chromobacterium phragmitis]|uniref:response regulator n=1 Tax=Chromobacterium phragmitis TaxID=2202141 RepID=UPI000DECEA68|nr:response regulator [Chromobacterium phragmitis]AXE32163.1 hybrid sensor histidine kinase/response regulator [Chromobacterium phragmitis]